MTDKTTELNELRQGADYVWGEVIKIHDIGDFSIVEFEDCSNNTVCYASYMSGKDLCCHSKTLEGALLFCIAKKNIKVTDKARYMYQACAILLNILED